MPKGSVWDLVKKRWDDFNGAGGTNEGYNDFAAPVSAYGEAVQLEETWEAWWVKMLKWAVDAAEGVAHLAKHDIVHRDLAARNLLVDGNDRVKIADFGLAIHVESTHTSIAQKDQVKAWKSRAPELIDIDTVRTDEEKSLISNPATDAYSFGMCLYEMTTGKEPWETEPEVHQTTISRRVKGDLAGCPPLREDARISPQWRGVSHEIPESVADTMMYHAPRAAPVINLFCTLMRKLWACRPADRPPVQEAYVLLRDLLHDQY